ncbi:hypothetical protein M8C21_009266, partial [Ambrosia artemisiifolia]
PRQRESGEQRERDRKKGTGGRDAASRGLWLALIETTADTSGNKDTKHKSSNLEIIVGSALALWDSTSESGGVPQLKGARAFTLNELQKYTNNFSEINNIGRGGYGMGLVLIAEDWLFATFDPTTKRERGRAGDGPGRRSRGGGGRKEKRWLQGGVKVKGKGNGLFR